MKITEKQKERIINMGAFDYDADLVSSIIDVDVNVIKKQMANPSSHLSKLLKKGRDLAQYKIDLKLFQLAQTGDLNALKELEKRRRLRQEKKNSRGRG